MESTQLTELRDQYERLGRNTFRALRSLDRVDMLDLVHCLRTWDDMRNLGCMRQCVKQLDFFNYIIPADGLPIGPQSEYFLAVVPQRLELPHLAIGMPFLILRPEKSGFESAVKPVAARLEVTSYSKWLDGVVLYCGTRSDNQADTVHSRLSRSQLISSLSNFFGGSHPVGTKQPFKHKAHIRDLVDLWSCIQVASVPLPYFCAAAIAKDLLRTFAPIVVRSWEKVDQGYLYSDLVACKDHIELGSNTRLDAERLPKEVFAATRTMREAIRMRGVSSTDMGSYLSGADLAPTPLSTNEWWAMLGK